MSYYRKRERVGLTFENAENLTKQAFAEETNVNQIMAKYQATGQFTHINRHPAQYGDFSQVDSLQGALDKIQEARAIFEAMPSETRQEFNHNLAAFVEFSQKASLEQLRDKGIIVEQPQQRDKEPLPTESTPSDPVPAEPPEQSSS